MYQFLVVGFEYPRSARRFRHSATAAMDAEVRAFAADVTRRGLSVKTAQWRSGARCVSDGEFVKALDDALVTASHDGVSRVYALHIDCGGGGDRGGGGGFGRKVKLVVGDDALKRAREACAGRGEVVRATTTRGATRDGSVRGMLDDERAARMEYYDAASDEMNAFRANTYGRVQMDSVERRSGGGRRSGAPASAPASAPAVKKPTPAATTTTTTTTTTMKTDSTKDTSTKTKDTAVPAKKSSNLMSMFAKAPQKKTAPVPKKEEKPAPVVAKKEEEKPVVVEKKAVANAEAAILEAEEDASDEDSDDDFGATRKPRRKRAMAVESEDEEEDEQPAAEEDNDFMEIEDEPTPTPTPAPKKAPGSSKKTTPTSAKKRKSKAQDEADDNDQDDAPSSNPTSASKKQKKDKPLSKKALLARRIKKTIEIMDEETGEETTRTIFVDEFDNELNEDGSYKFPDENVKTAA